jgi:arylsulfatase
LEADKYLVTPLDDRSSERFNAELAGRPELITGNTQIFGPTMKRLSENSVIVIKNKSHSVTAMIDMPKGIKAEGTMIAQGGKFGGWSLYAKNGKVKYCYNYMALEMFYVESSKEVPAGEHQVRTEFAYDGKGLGKGGTATLYIDGKAVGKGRIDKTVMATFSLDETTDVGEETGTTVTEDCQTPNRFNGTIRFVQIDVGLDDKDHFLSKEERFRIAMARQ